MLSTENQIKRQELDYLQERQKHIVEKSSTETLHTYNMEYKEFN